MENNRIYIKNHEGTFFYRVAALIIENNKLLVAKNVDHPVYYTIGGGINLNETSEEAIIREVMEETELKLKISKLKYVQERFLKINNEKYHEIVLFYTMDIKEKIDIIENTYTDQGNKETLHWLPLEQLKNVNLVPEFLKYKILNNNNNNGIEHIISKEY